MKKYLWLLIALCAVAIGYINLKKEYTASELRNVTLAAGARASDKQLLNNSLYEKMIKTGELDVGFVVYPPSFIVNPDGTKAGIFKEIMDKVGANLEIKVNYVAEVNWDTMIQDVQSGKVDMIVTGIWPTTQRAKQVDFAKPIFYSVVKAYTFAGNVEYDNNPNKINSEKTKIVTLDGEMSQIIATADFPKAKTITVTQLTGVPQLLLDVANRKADVTFIEPAIALEYMSKNPNTIKEIEGLKPMRVFPNAMMIPKNQEAFKSTLNLALDEIINNGFVDKIINKYEKYPGSYSRLNLLYDVREK